MEYFTDMRNILNHKKKTLTTASDCAIHAFRIKEDKQNRIKVILKETIELNRASTISQISFSLEPFRLTAKEKMAFERTTGRSVNM